MPLNLIDIVVDTNVLCHAENPDAKCFAASVFFLKDIINGNAKICIDCGFKMDRGRNRSKIYHEYLTHTKRTHGAVTSTFFSEMFGNNRFSELSKLTGQEKQRKINMSISDNYDRIFLGVAYNSEEQKLISQDFEHFPKGKRPKIRQEIKVLILCSKQPFLQTFNKCRSCKKI